MDASFIRPIFVAAGCRCARLLVGGPPHLPLNFPVSVYPADNLLHVREYLKIV